MKADTPGSDAINEKNHTAEGAITVMGLLARGGTQASVSIGHEKDVVTYVIIVKVVIAQ